MDVTDSILGLAHIGVMVSDVEVSKKFYQDILSLEVLHENTIDHETGIIKVCFMKKNDLVLELIQMSEFDRNRKDGTVDHIAFKVKNIQVVKDALMNKGIAFIQEEIISCEKLFENGAKWILFRGPDKEYLELNETL